MLHFLLGSAVIVLPRGNLALLAAIGAVKGAGEHMAGALLQLPVVTRPRHCWVAFCIPVRWMSVKACFIMCYMCSFRGNVLGSLTKDMTVHGFMQQPVFP